MQFNQDSFNEETQFNQNIFDASYDVLSQAGCPDDLNLAVSTILGNDDATLPQLGRSDEENDLVLEATRYLIQE